MKLTPTTRNTTIGTSELMSQRFDELSQMLSTPFCKVSVQVVVQTLLESMTVEEIAAHVRPVVAAIDAERGTRFKLSQQIGQLRHRLRKLAEADEAARAELTERLRKLEAERDEA